MDECSSSINLRWCLWPPNYSSSESSLTIVQRGLSWVSPFSCSRALALPLSPSLSLPFSLTTDAVELTRRLWHELSPFPQLPRTGLSVKAVEMHPIIPIFFSHKKDAFPSFSTHPQLPACHFIISTALPRFIQHKLPRSAGISGATHYS